MANSMKGSLVRWQVPYWWWKRFQGWLWCWLCFSVLLRGSWEGRCWWQWLRFLFHAISFKVRTERRSLGVWWWWYRRVFLLHRLCSFLRVCRLLVLCIWFWLFKEILVWHRRCEWFTNWTCFIRTLWQIRICAIRSSWQLLFRLIGAVEERRCRWSRWKWWWWVRFVCWRWWRRWWLSGLLGFWRWLESYVRRWIFFRSPE